MMEWNYTDLQNWINNGCDKDVAKQVIILDISYNELENIPKEISYLKIPFLKLKVSEMNSETLILHECKN